MGKVPLLGTTYLAKLAVYLRYCSYAARLVGQTESILDNLPITAKFPFVSRHEEGHIITAIGPDLAGTSVILRNHITKYRPGNGKEIMRCMHDGVASRGTGYSRCRCKMSAHISGPVQHF